MASNQLINLGEMKKTNFLQPLLGLLLCLSLLRGSLGSPCGVSLLSCFSLNRFNGLLNFFCGSFAEKWHGLTNLDCLRHRSIPFFCSRHNRGYGLLLLIGHFLLIRGFLLGCLGLPGLEGAVSVGSTLLLAKTCHLNFLGSLLQDKFHVAWCAHEGVNPTVGTVSSTSHLASAVHGHVLDGQQINVQTLVKIKKNDAVRLKMTYHRTFNTKLHLT